QLGVIGEQTTRSDDDKEVLWYKIAPPAGEYRWIQASAVSTQPITPSPRGQAASRQAPVKKNRHTGTEVVSAAYQADPDADVVVLGDPADAGSARARSTAPYIVSGSYPRAPRPGEVINGEVVVSEEYAPGDIIHEQTMDGSDTGGSIAGGDYYEGEY